MFLDRESAKKADVLKVTWAGILINIILSLLKLIIGYVGRSHALMADGVHSFSDIVTDLAVLLGVRYWSAPPDDDHPYGHLKIETLITSFIGLALIFAAFGIGYRAIVSVEVGHIAGPEWIVVLVAFISIVLKEFLYRWTKKVAAKIGSAALLANAWHHRSDAFSSIPVLLAALVSIIYPQWAFVDRIGAFVVAIFILRVAYKIMKSALFDLADMGASCAERVIIEDIARSVEGVREVHAIRSRRVGMGLHIDLHVLVDGHISVKEGHDIAEIVKIELLRDGPAISDVITHIEPYLP